MPAPPAPTCPRCDYDLSGSVATWTGSCPMQVRCPECGRSWPTYVLFTDHTQGPVWSVEHARRRFIRRWLRTSVMGLRPRRLWRELRPEHPIEPRRLALMAASWLLTLHLLTAALLAGSWAWMGVQAPGMYGRLRDWPGEGWPFWSRVLRGLAWPYSGWVQVPTSSSSSFSDPIRVFVILTVVPQLAMAGLIYLWARPLRRRELSAVHLVRAVVLSLPCATAWLAVIVLAFGGEALGASSVYETASGVIAVAPMAGLVVGLIWWWRCFVVEYLGIERWPWMIVVLGFAAMAITVGVEIGVDTLSSGGP